MSTHNETMLVADNSTSLPDKSYPLHPDAASNNTANDLPPHMVTTTTTTTTTNMVIVGVLVGLICILTIILMILLVRPIMEYIRSKLPENKRRKELRYRTIEGWVISKVC